MLTFPELSDDKGATEAVPSIFNHMSVGSPTGEPTCRLRLEANWTMTEQSRVMWSRIYTGS